MNIVDTSCWIEYLINTPIGTAVAPVIEKPTELIVPAITLYEVYKKLLLEKDDDYALNIITYMRSGTVIMLDSDLSVLSAQISLKYKLPMADSIIYATCMQHSAVLWTTDKHFKDIPGVRYFSKTK